FNGDADAMKNLIFHLFGQTLDNDQLRVLLAKVHYKVPIPAGLTFKEEKELVDAVIPVGDCPTVAGLMDLFHTQGFWFPSLKYALTVHVRENLQDLPPEEARLRAWAKVFDVAYATFSKQLNLQPGQSIEDLSEEDLQKFQAFLMAILATPQNMQDFFH